MPSLLCFTRILLLSVFAMTTTYLCEIPFGGQIWILCTAMVIGQLCAGIEVAEGLVNHLFGRSTSTPRAHPGHVEKERDRQTGRESKYDCHTRRRGVVVLWWWLNLRAKINGKAVNF